MMMSTLEAAGVDLNDAGQLAQAHNAALGNVPNVHLAVERHHVVLALREELNVLQSNETIRHNPSRVP